MTAHGSEEPSMRPYGYAAAVILAISAGPALSTAADWAAFLFALTVLAVLAVSDITRVRRQRR